jgi:hypothetical protein
MNFHFFRKVSSSGSSIWHLIGNCPPSLLDIKGGCKLGSLVGFSRLVSFLKIPNFFAVLLASLPD